MPGVRLDFAQAFVWTQAATQRNGCVLHVYENGTTTAVSLFSDRDCTTPAANPIVSSAGFFPPRFIADAELLTLTCKDSLGNTLWTADDIEPFAGATGSNDAISGTAPALTFRETDQALPLGLWRLRLSGNTFALERNTAVAGDFSTYVTAFDVSSTSRLTAVDLEVSGDVDFDSADSVILPDSPSSNNEEAGYRDAPPTSQTANGNLSFALTDRGRLFYHTDAGTHTWTIPANASVAFPVGTVILLENENGGGNVTIAITSDTLRWGSSTGSRTLAANGSAVLKKVASTVWRLTGTGIS